jgi:hypothetical protein
MTLLGANPGNALSLEMAFEAKSWEQCAPF